MGEEGWPTPTDLPDEDDSNNSGRGSRWQTEMERQNQGGSFGEAEKAIGKIVSHAVTGTWAGLTFNSGMNVLGLRGNL